jgi:polysaccharide export outer membrane protein
MCFGSWFRAAGSTKLMADTKTTSPMASEYKLGVGDQLNIWVAQLDQFSGKIFTVDREGCITPPMAGRLYVKGMTVGQAEEAVKTALRRYIRDPEVGLSLAETKNEGVSITGSVARPGVYQLSQGRTLVEMLMMAGGLQPTAGPFAAILRPLSSGRLPLAGAHNDSTGKYSLAQINVRALLSLQKSADNIALMAGDTVSVSEARMVYVVGDVNKPGAFPVNDERQMTALQALAMAGGPLKSAAPQSARIVRSSTPGRKPDLIDVNLKRLLKGKTEDLQMEANDVLFVPSSAQKAITARAVDAAVQTAIFAITYGGML